MLKEFREFAIKGNMIDLAIGVVIGTAFGAIVSSLVADLIMPAFGWMLGNVDFSNFFVTLKEGTPPGPYATVDAAQKAGAVTINYGLFINTVVRFFIIAFALFFVVRTMNRLKREEEAGPAEPEAPEDVKLLREIRDLLQAERKA